MQSLFYRFSRADSIGGGEDAFEFRRKSVVDGALVKDEFVSTSIPATGESVFMLGPPMQERDVNTVRPLSGMIVSYPFCCRVVVILNESILSTLFRGGLLTLG